MTDILKIIQQRRSVRKFKEKKLIRRDINKILEAGRWAPSGLNNQPWRFYIVSNKKQKDDLAQLTKYSSIIANASIVIAVCLDNADSYNREKDLMALGACIQNMLLEAKALTIGSCWIGEILNKKEEVQSLLRLDTDCELAAIVAFGISAEKNKKGCRKALKKLMLK